MKFHTLASMCLVALLNPFLIPSVNAQATRQTQNPTPTQRAQPPKILPKKVKSAKPSSTPTAAPLPTPAPAAAAIPAAKANYVPVSSANAIRVNYGFPLWNSAPTKIDSASIIMREGVSGRLVQIQLVETAPDSAIFSGLYSINWQNIEKLKVEFYIPPQSQLDTTEGMKKVATLISSGQLKRNPFILRRTATGSQTIEIFDTREQAQTALKAYRAEQQLQAQSPDLQKFPSDQQIETAKLGAELLAREAMAKAEADRMRIEQLEGARLAAMKAREAALNEAERAARRAEAQTLSAEGLSLFRESKFPEAVAKFERAVELDPENRGHYFQFGVALYKLENFNKSLVYVRMAEGPTVNLTEKDFFIGLNHFGLKEYDSSLAAFTKVALANEPNMSPAARFYIGLILFEQKNWDPARAAFQEVLDKSSDPQLDARAETYLEQILRIQQFEAEKARKWQISGTLGEQYDSNILLISDSSLSQGTASNTEGWRTLLLGSARYRPVYEETREFAVQLDVLTMYTLDKSFKGDQSLRNADPTVATLTLPWTYKGLLFGKGYKLDLTPGYESIWMSVEDNTNKAIITSYLLNAANLFVMSNSLFSNFNLELRKDQSNLTSSVGDNDSTAIKVKLINSNLHFLTDDKVKILTTDAAVTLNQSQGKNSAYNRLDLGVGYIQPFYWETNANVKLGYFWLNYPQKNDNRLDNSWTLSLGASKKISESYSAGLSANYNINNSNVDSNAFKKWTALLTFSALTGF